MVVQWVVACALLGTTPGQTDTPSDRVLLACDDYSIPWLDNLHLTLVQAEKHPANPVLRRGPLGAPDHGQAILYGSVIRVGDTFRMWYLGMPNRRLEHGLPVGAWRPMCYAESADGVHWTKPALGLVEFAGSRENNICRIESSDVGLTLVDDFLSVLYEPQDPDPERRYKAAYIVHYPWDEVRGGVRPAGPKERRLCAMVTAVSGDGLRWRVLGDRPCVDEKFEVSGLYRFGDFYYATGQQLSPWSWLADGSPAGRVMIGYRSADLVHWSSAKGLAFARPSQTIDSPTAGTQTHVGAGLWNRGNVLVGLYGMWQDGPPQRPRDKPFTYGVRIDLGLILSNDGRHFREPVPNFKILAHGAEGQWDAKSLLQGHAFATVGERTYLWYSHWDTDAEGLPEEIGLATLRRDGFGYLACHDPRRPGHCVTATLPAGPRGPRLAVNVTGVTPERPLVVELLDAFDRPLTGFSGPDAAKITAPGVDRPVIWPARSNQHGPQRQAFSVRVCFPASDAVRLFALYVSAY